MFTTRNLILVVLAGIVGTIANSIAITLFLGAPIWPLIFSFGREIVAILVAALLIPIFGKLPEAQAWPVALVVLTVVPSVLAKLVFGLGAPWGTVLLLNLVYAVAATLVYSLGRRG